MRGTRNQRFHHTAVRWQRYAQGFRLKGVVIHQHTDFLPRPAPGDNLHALGGRNGFDSALRQNRFRQSGNRAFIQGTAQVIDRAWPLTLPGGGGELPVKGIAVAVKDLGVPDLQHVPEDASIAVCSGKCALSHYGERVLLLEALRFRHRHSGESGVAHGQDLPKEEVIVRVLHPGPVGEHQRTAFPNKPLRFGLKFRLHDGELGQEHNLIAGKVRLRRNHVHGDIPVVKGLVKFLHFPRAVQQEALALNAEGGQGVVIVDNGHIAVNGSLQGLCVLGDLPEEALDLIEFPPLHVVRVDDAVAELLRPFGGPPVAEVHHGAAPVGHPLVGPHLGLVGPGQEAGDVVALGPHDGLGDPEVFPFQPPDVVQAEGNLVGGDGLLLPAPDGVVVIGRHVQALGHPGVADMLVQPAAGEVVHHQGVRVDLVDEPGLEVHKVHNALVAEPLPVQAQGGVVGGNSLSGEGYLVEVVVLLGPEGGAVGVVQPVDVPGEFFLEEALEGPLALGAPAQVAALVADLVVDLPGRNLFLPLVVAHQGPDDLLRVLVHLRAVEAVDVPSAEGPLLPVLELGEDGGVFFGQPGGDGGVGGAHDDVETFLLGLGDDAVEEGKVVLALGFLHQVPGELADADYIAPHL